MQQPQAVIFSSDVPPHGSSNLQANAPPYRPISKRVQEEAEAPLEQLLADVLDQAKRRTALDQLTDMRTSVPDFSLKIWHSPGMIALILQEILRIYPYLYLEDEIPEDDSHRASCAIALLQPIALDERLRADFLRAQIPDYLYPFVMNLKESKGFNKVRLASLGVIGCLVKKSDIRAVMYLLQSEIVALCIRCTGVHSCKLAITVAVYILAKILATEIGLAFICNDQEQFLEIFHILASMFKHPHIKPSKGLLKWAVFCYYSFSCNPRVCKTLRYYLPDTFKDGSFRRLFQGDQETVDRVLQVMLNTSFI